MTPNLLLSAKKLVVRRTNRFSLDIPSLLIQKGKIYCVAGANGSGKTTLLETLAGLIRPDEGSVRLLGLDTVDQPVDAKRLYGYVPDDDDWLIAELTAKEYIQLLASIYAPCNYQSYISAAYKLAEQLFFTSTDQQLGALSHGNRKKIQIIAAMAHQPPLLIVDELRNGLDPVVAKRCEELINDYVAQGGTVFAASHDLWWAERLADKVMLINNGRLVLEDTTARIKQRYGSVEARFMELYAHK